ncbi:hypothetical protein FB45DRAFT_1037607 [Roridomyces roridus]|uniref:DUF6593 domain-containing protein n=1 Tax=Roridomyces roridus TaxID=1738132 RepID=A0AAD7B5M2_9AGAR|nr:hypothetical protein FB45DRAFT_1037607 [Roridomyces roridus]
MYSALALAPRAQVRLTFFPDSMNNSTLYLGGLARYKLCTTGPFDSLVEISERGTSDSLAVVARISHNVVRPSTVVFPRVRGDQSEWKVKKWMAECTVDGNVAHLIELDSIGQCLLKLHREYRLALYTPDDPRTPIAHWQRGTARNSPLSLVLYPGTENIQPQIMAAFVIQEQRMRMVEKKNGLALAPGAA